MSALFDMVSAALLRATTYGTAGGVARLRRSDMGVRGLDAGESAALIINEAQNAMVDPAFGGDTGLAAEAARRGMVARIAELARACRAAGVLVVHTTMTPRPDGV
jgi:hypothetical protein